MTQEFEKDLLESVKKIVEMGNELLKSVQNPEVCDATTDDTSTSAGNKNISPDEYISVDTLLKIIEENRQAMITAREKKYDAIEIFETENIYTAVIETYDFMFETICKEQVKAKTKTPSIYPSDEVYEDLLDTVFNWKEGDGDKLLRHLKMNYNLSFKGHIDENPDPVEVKSDAVEFAKFIGHNFYYEHLLETWIKTDDEKVQPKTYEDLYQLFKNHS